MHNIYFVQLIPRAKINIDAVFVRATRDKSKNKKEKKTVKLNNSALSKEIFSSWILRMILIFEVLISTVAKFGTYLFQKLLEHSILTGFSFFLAHSWTFADMKIFRANFFFVISRNVCSLLHTPAFKLKCYICHSNICALDKNSSTPTMYTMRKKN